MLGPMQVLYIYLMPAHAHILGTRKPTWNLQLSSPKMPRGKVNKRTRTSQATGGNKKSKSAASSAASSSDDSTPLTRGDIPTIVSAVLQSIRSSHAQEEGEPTAPALPG